MKKYKTQFILLDQTRQIEFPKRRCFKTALGVIITLPIQSLGVLKEIQQILEMHTQRYWGKIPIYLILTGVELLAGYQTLPSICGMDAPINQKQFKIFHHALQEQCFRSLKGERSWIQNSQTCFFPQQLACFYPDILAWNQKLNAKKYLLRGVYFTAAGLTGSLQMHFEQDMQTFSLAYQCDEYLVRYRKRILFGLGAGLAILLSLCWIFVLKHDEYRPIVHAVPIIAPPSQVSIPVKIKLTSPLQVDDAWLKELATLQCSFPSSLKNNLPALRLIYSAFFSGGRPAHFELVWLPLYLSKNLAEFQVQDQNQSLFYQNGPRFSQTFTWLAGSGAVEVTFTDLKGQVLTQVYPGLWGLIHFLNAATHVKLLNNRHAIVRFAAGEYTATYEVSLVQGNIEGVFALKGITCKSDY